MTEEQPARYQPTPEEAAANAAKLLAEAERLKAVAEHYRKRVEEADHAAREAKARADAAEAKSRCEIAENIKLALVHERNIETIKGEDAYRRIYQFKDEVTRGSVEKALINLNAWHAADPRGKWEIHLFTPGGDMYSGLRFYDYLSMFKRTHDIDTVAMGACMSMGSILLQAGTTRYMGRETTIMIHKGSLRGWVDEDFDKFVEHMEFMERVKHERIARIFEERAAQSNAPHKITVSYLKKHWTKADWYLDSDACLDLGIVDEVV